MKVPTDINPYASPQELVGHSHDSQQTAIRLVRTPSVALFVLSTTWLAVGICGLAFVSWLWSEVIANRLTYDDAGLSIWHLLDLMILLSSGFVLYGAWCMRRGRRFRLAVAAAIAACIPLLSPWGFLGIPFGIWALVVLCRREVRAAFDPPR